MGADMRTNKLLLIYWLERTCMLYGYYAINRKNKNIYIHKSYNENTTIYNYTLESFVILNNGRPN